MYVCAVNGSPNTEGNTAFLLNTVLDILNGEGCETEIIQIGKIMGKQKQPFCVNCSSPCNTSCFKGTELMEVFEKMRRADVLLFGSPVYFGGPTAQLKALFDKSRFYRKEKAYLGKPAAVLTVGGSKYGGQETTVKSLQDCLLVQGMVIMGDGSMDFDAGHQGICAHRPAKDDEFALQRCESLARRILEL